MVNLGTVVNVLIVSATVAFHADHSHGPIPGPMPGPMPGPKPGHGFWAIQKKIKCGNCVSVANHNNDDAGFDCTVDDMAITYAPPGRRQSSMKSPILPDCLPPKFEIVDTMYEYCCFWSPHLGCTQVYAASYLKKHKANCSVCEKPCGNIKKPKIVQNSSARMIDMQKQSIYIYFLSILVHDFI